MKANEAPEKIWINPLTDLPKLNGIVDRDSVQYIRRDAFIEKACLWLSNVSIEDMTYKYNDFDTSEDWYKFIENFRKHMSL